MNPLTLFLQTRYGQGPRSREALQKLQARGFDYIRREVMPRSPFHAPWAGRPAGEWPLLNKQQMMEHFSAINTRGITREAAMELALRAEAERDFSPMIGDVAIGLSTGTSGQRGLFASDRRERGLWAAFMLGRFLPSLITPQRIAFFLRSSNQLYESLSRGLITFEFYDLLRDFEAHKERLIRTRPTVLIAPAQILGLLAEEALPIRPQKIISVAEVLSPEDRIRIEEAFGVPVDQVYQCTEGVLGMTCRAGHLHLNEAHIHIEREVIDPQTGAFHPILTDLTRRTLPILRYRLDDVLVPAPGVCPCGSVTLRLDRIEGRADDILWWPGEEGGLRMIPSDALRQVIALTRTGIRDYRLRQTGQERLEIWLQTDAFDAACAGVRAGLESQARQLRARLPRLEFHPGLPAETGAKRRRVTARP